jgi:hypothetical protein
MPRIPDYGHDGSMLMFPVSMEIDRIDRVASRADPSGGWDDVFGGKVRDPDGTEHVLYFPTVTILAQYAPPSATEHAGKQIPGINGNDTSFKVHWCLSRKDLTAKGLIDVATGRTLLQPGDRVLRTRDRDTADLYEDYTHVELVISQIQQRQGNSDGLIFMYLDDVSKSSVILAQ